MPPLIVLHTIVSLLLVGLQFLASFTYTEACLLVFVMLLTSILWICGEILEKLEETKKESK